MRRSLIPAVLLLCITIAPARAQQAAEPTPEQTIAALRSQWQALFVASLLNARAHGQSTAEFGTSIGRIFAPSWAQDLTPQGLARGMRANIRYGARGATVTDYDEALKAVVRQIAVDHGLVWDQRADGSRLVAKVTRKR